MNALSQAFKDAGINTNPACPYCDKKSKLVTGEAIYPHRPDLYKLNFYQCKPCGAYVGTHKGTILPLGRLANAELRKAKSEAHSYFDPIWKNGEMKRKEAYAWLAHQMGIERKDCHIGMFDVGMCKKVVSLVISRRCKMSSIDLL